MGSCYRDFKEERRMLSKSLIHNSKTKEVKNL